jgi:hypothetical protein
LVSVMNDTKWDELRLAMYELGASSPLWRTKTLGSGYVCEWDGEWFYHFRIGGYADIEWVEIKIASPPQKMNVLTALRRVHVPGHETGDGFRVYGYVKADERLEYL